MSRIEPIDPLSRIAPISPIAPTESVHRDLPTYSASSPIAFSSDLSSKPSLAPPDSFIKSEGKSIALILANILNRLESFKQKFQEILDREIEDANKVSQINLEKHDAIVTELKEVTEKSDYWSFLINVGAYLVGAASIVLGATLLVPAASTLAIVAGCSMILSGSASILGSILSEMNTHPQIATVLMVTGSALGLVGGITGAFLGITSITNNIVRLVTASLSVVTGSAELVKDRYLWQAADIKASEALIKKADEINRAQLASMGQDLNYFEKETSCTTTSLIVANRRLQASTRKITELSA